MMPVAVNEEWETPAELFNPLDDEFRFSLDVAADHVNRKASAYYHREMDGLSHRWASERCWCNPPYGRETGRWIRKAYEESKQGALVVCLVPARTETDWFHECCLGKAEIRFLRGRVYFYNRYRGIKDRPRFPSMLVIFRP